MYKPTGDTVHITSPAASPPSKPEFKGAMYRPLAELARWTDQHTEAPIEPDLPIVDTHHHLWHDKRGTYLLPEYAAELAQGHRVVSTVYVEGSAMYTRDATAELQPVGEVAFAAGVAAMADSGHFGPTRVCEAIVSHADLMLGDRVEEVLTLQRAASGGRLRGIRHGVPWDTGDATRFGRHHVPQHRLLDPAFQTGFARLQSMHLSFDAWMFFHQLPDLVELLERHPGARVVLNHCGGILGVPPHDADRDEVFRVWRSNMRRLSEHPALRVKVGGLGMLYGGWNFHGASKPPGSTQLAEAWAPYVETCLELFGAKRCMAESNFPVDKQSCGWGVLWNAMKRITSQCTPQEKQDFYCQTAVDFYRLKPITPSQ